VQRALDDSLSRSFSTLTTLDFTNAFNTAERVDIAASLRNYCPSLYRTAKWAYNAASDLVLGQHILQSATGVRQGDPLGPLLLSLAIRPLLDRLSTFLGTDHLVLAYLDDVYVLSPAQELASAQGLTSTLEKIYSFFDSSPSSLKLNRTKCTGKTLSDIKEHGCNILGSCVGSPQSQAAFLATIYPLTTASSSSPICPRSTSQSLHPSSGRSISYSSRSAPTLSPALPKTPSSPSSPFQSSASNQQRAYSPKAEDWRQITWTASLTRPDPNRITGHHRKATQSPTSADSSPRDALAPPRTWSGETPRFWT